MALDSDTVNRASVVPESPSAIATSAIVTRGGLAMIASDQALSVPERNQLLLTSSVHVPRELVPSSTDSGELGRNVPRNGGEPSVIAVGASSSKIVSSNSAPRKNPMTPTSGIRVPPGETSVRAKRPASGYVI